MTQDTQFRIVRKIGSCKNKKQHAIGCEYSPIEVDSCQLMIKHTAGVRKELRDQCIATCNGKPPWSTNAVVHTVREIEPHDVVSSGIFAD